MHNCDSKRKHKQRGQYGLPAAGWLDALQQGHAAATYVVMKRYSEGIKLELVRYAFKSAPLAMVEVPHPHTQQGSAKQSGGLQHCSCDTAGCPSVIMYGQSYYSVEMPPYYAHHNPPPVVPLCVFELVTSSE